MFLSLERRIAIVFVGLVVVVMAAMLFIVARGSESLITQESRHQLRAGAENFSRLIGREERQLEMAARVLTADFSFREAIATQDRGTVLSVLRNHGLRIGANVMMVVALDGSVIVDTQRPGEASRQFPFQDLLRRAEQAGSSGGIARMADNRYYQMVMMQVLAPTRIAWVATGFLIGDDWARDHARVSGLDVSIVTPGREVVASSLNPGARRDISAAMLALNADGATKFKIAGGNHDLVAQPFGADAHVILSRSIANSEGLVRNLEYILLLIAGAGIALFAGGSMFVARRIAGPVNDLLSASQRIAKGDYNQPIKVTSDDEVGQLARGYEAMRVEIAQREAKILRLAYEDELTGLPNRTRLSEYLQSVDGATRTMIAVLDLDRFAAINDALGHPVGDEMLQQVARRLTEVLGNDGMLARLWGDEFAFVLPGADAGRVAMFCGRLADALGASITINDQRLDVNGSTGIAFRPDDGDSIDTLLQRAELAMFEAKKRQSGVMFARDVGTGPAPENLSLIGEMRAALDRDEFIVHYQPKLALGEKRIVGVEALLRWHHPERGLVPPSRFIPFAEQTGFIRQLTPWLLSSATKQAAEWRNHGINLVISVNISARDLLDSSLVSRTKDLLALHELPPSLLCLEITESALMEDPTLALSHLVEFAAMGLKLSIDDYGAGQASLAYVKSLPVNELKIDQSFIGSLGSSPKDAAIVRSTIALGHALGLTVVAEGIESRADLQWLTEAGCDVGQGYLVSRPLASEDFVAWYSALGARGIWSCEGTG